MLLCVCSVMVHRWRQNVVKTKKWHTSNRRVCHLRFFLLWSITEQTHGNIESICFILWPEKKKRPIHIISSYRLTVRRFVLKSQTLLFVSASSLFLYRTCIQFLRKFFNVFSCSNQNNGENILQNSESLVAMAHDGNCCEDFLLFTHPQVLKNSFCLRFSIFLLFK